MSRSEPWFLPRTAYVHIPFCGHQCGYCDFAVTAGRDHLIEPYLQALTLELERFKEPRPIESLFLGGGTPTYLSAQQLEYLFTQLDRWLPRVGELPEVTIESTPESITPEKVSVLASHGVNRISIGVQSFQSRTLQALDRRHGVESIAEALTAVRETIPQVSFDLIYAAPGQTLADWQRDLDDALRWKPSHLSCYGLTYEIGTPLWKDRKKGLLIPVTEDLELEMYRYACETLVASGFHHYEVSNFARPGFESRHNRRYWANEAYYGVGLGAARYVQGSRELNTRDIQGYIRKLSEGQDPTFQREVLPPRERAFETIAVQLRRAEGVCFARFAEQTGYDFWELVGTRAEPLISLGLLVRTEQELTLSVEGRSVADAVTAEFMKAMPEPVERV